MLGFGVFVLAGPGLFVVLLAHHENDGLLYLGVLVVPFLIEQLKLLFGRGEAAGLCWLGLCPARQ